MVPGERSTSAEINEPGSKFWKFSPRKYKIVSFYSKKMIKISKLEKVL
jgi:hypothetical protein